MLRLACAATAILAAACAYDRPALAPLDDATPSDGVAATDAPIDGAAACATDDACRSQVCDGGTCLPSDDARYVAPIGDDAAPCSQAAPCRTVARALAARGARAIVVLASGTYPATVRINPLTQSEPPFDVLLVGGADASQDPAVITATSDGSNSDGIEVYRGRVRLRNLTVTGSTMNDASDAIWTQPSTTVTLERVTVGPSPNDGLACNGCALTATGGAFIDNGHQGVQVNNGAATLVANVITRNAGGGLVIDATACTIASNLVVANGALGGAVGGASIKCTDHRVEHNTFTRNLALDTAASNYQCGSTGIGAINRNNLFDGPARTATGCGHTYSLFTAGMPPAGAGNLVGGPGFVSATDAHITAASAARGAADPATPTDLTIDVDGQARVQGLRDIGADEIP
ncbi:MAG: right-handed parallel beta-helix repeat-containing protein [Myxococcales bacterium]|nr:right-handed parallel beta-helix repeat-containing protein [Myxococcales bacterium]